MYEQRLAAEIARHILPHVRDIIREIVFEAVGGAQLEIDRRLITMDSHVMKVGAAVQGVAGRLGKVSDEIDDLGTKLGNIPRSGMSEEDAKALDDAAAVLEGIGTKLDEDSTKLEGFASALAQNPTTPVGTDPTGSGSGSAGPAGGNVDGPTGGVGSDPLNTGTGNDPNA